ncbi:hypothetical protein EXM90_11400 [Clostridium botulinum]|uniref:hypothetical protein n=1 Tax=Clostridium botulinum TaxID=1491 RepID=UPI000774D182|nr:hypothetical protein [Clostridium botulinum]MBN3367249.1 hypothetical protein [Clostridium botulinum]MBN3371633.1 hypothetical protein [Clostridium botulinum]MBN3375561.1 hypothetical protein [Clostridium botulinum]MBN3384218.1 hypothetical protein [Clostridium botulinum]MBN3402818.1 hypothetical protein [Clostridium botulinum]
MIYIILKNNIRDTYHKGEYEKCNENLKNLYKAILIDKQIYILERDQMILYYYYYKVKILLSQKNFKNALLLCLKSFRYILIDERDKYNFEYKKMLELLAEIYKNLGNKEQSIKTYEYLLTLSNKKDYKTVLKNINRLKEDEKIIKFNDKTNKKYDSNKENNFKICCYF